MTVMIVTVFVATHCVTMKFLALLIEGSPVSTVRLESLESANAPHDPELSDRASRTGVAPSGVGWPNARRPSQDGSQRKRAEVFLAEGKSPPAW
jgi:hypothetical protein